MTGEVAFFWMEIYSVIIKKHKKKTDPIQLMVMGPFSKTHPNPAYTLKIGTWDFGILEVDLVGGWTTHLKICSSIWIISPRRGENKKYILETTT